MSDLPGIDCPDEDCRHEPFDTANGLLIHASRMHPDLDRAMFDQAIADARLYGVDLAGVVDESPLRSDPVPADSALLLQLVIAGVHMGAVSLDQQQRDVLDATMFLFSCDVEQCVAEALGGYLVSLAEHPQVVQLVELREKQRAEVGEL